MPVDCTYIPYSETGYFSRLVQDYIAQHPNLSNLYTYSPDNQGLDSAIEARANYKVNRQTLVAELKEQYAQLPVYQPVHHNINLLASEDTFTVCTAHQPNLLSGYLYFIYKIIHAIKLAEDLKTLHPAKNFVPVYYIGSEDNDLDELGTFRYEGRKYIWDAAGQTGAVGRMSTQSLKPLLDELFKVLGPPGDNLKQLKQLLTDAYLKHTNIAGATQYLVNDLFGKYGLIALNPDVPAFKRAILPIIKDDLFAQTALPIVNQEIEKIEKHYKAQAHPREINLFYLKDNIRERIEKKADKWLVLNTDIAFTEDELLAELEQYPERFSPNVILRGLFQESILPNIAFIGGGAEVAYWLQLQSLFHHYNVFYPVVMLRQSVQWIDIQQHKLRNQLGLSIADVFKNDVQLVRQFVTGRCKDEWQTGEETAAMEKIMNELKQKAHSLDPTLRSSAEAVITKVKHQLQVLETKMLRAEKRKMQTELQRINKLKTGIFPNNSLQERTDNFMQWFLQYGYEYFDIVKNAMQPLRQQFLVLEEI